KKILPKNVALRIRFKNVTFVYENNPQKILQTINFTIEPHSITAIIGASGSGKSTLIHLIAGFMHASAGDIYINDENLCDLDIAYWRNHFALLSQNTRLFQHTIRENIRLAKADATDKEIETAVEKAC